MADGRGLRDQSRKAWWFIGRCIQHRFFKAAEPSLIRGYFVQHWLISPIQCLCELIAVQSKPAAPLRHSAFRYHASDTHPFSSSPALASMPRLLDSPPTWNMKHVHLVISTHFSFPFVPAFSDGATCKWPQVQGWRRPCHSIGKLTKP